MGIDRRMNKSGSWSRIGIGSGRRKWSGRRSMREKNVYEHGDADRVVVGVGDIVGGEC